MAEMRTYRLSRFTTAMTVLVLTGLTIGGILTGISELRDGVAPVDLLAGPFLVLLLGTGWWRLFLSLPRVIILHPSDMLEFRAPMRTRTVAVGDLQSISCGWSMTRFRHPGGEIELVQQFDGFHELIATIKSKNPGVTLRGC